MIRFVLFIQLSMLFYSCVQKAKHNDVLVLIESEYYYQYHIESDEYAVYDVENSEYIRVDMNLTDEEIKKINRLYDEYEMYEFEENTNISDGCNEFPKIFTDIIIRKTNGSLIKITIDDSCTMFSRKGKRVKKFIIEVKQILENKKEVIDLPQPKILLM
ncbi:Uncharacterised protein [Bergeyella zoohelcum]|uniref:Lipoprotein n=2 Tax=Bergeyella zoohelcum TaxID=1015 RepID=A0A7Z8YPZ3_9FLAO|nr:hypothetical protein [Bergeyella zoohelcum]EKB60668.1 hypothetical protein HMPREF9700_00163 [Bergeyella zoohelcum CCUG 30536]VDH03400.1 Uncharacterised protein [Bergeyella zoohelcum]